MRKIISILMIVIIFAGNIVNAASGDSYQDGYNAGYNAGYNDGYDKVSTPKEPNVILINQNQIPEGNAGESFKFNIDFKNDSEYTARNIKITPIFENVPLVYERPIVYEAGKSLKKYSTDTAFFTFKIKENAKNGVYPINFKIEYKNTSDENFSKTGISYFKVTGEKMQSIVTISNITTNPDNINAGEVFTLSFNVNNIGDMAMTNTSIKLTDLKSDGFMPIDGLDYIYVGNVPAKSSVTRTFNMIASEKITSGSHSIGVTIKYNDENNEEVTEEKTIYLLHITSKNSDDTEEKSVSKPKIIIQSYSTSPDNIVAGDSFVFNFKIKNTSRNTGIKNMKITISSENGSFMIANGSNTFYVERLAPQEAMTNSIKLNVKQDLTSKSYPIGLDFDYEDSNNNSYQTNEVINIPVVEYSNLVINNVGANEGFVDQQTSLSFDYINMGKAVVSNLTASVEGDYMASQAINYIGNLEAGNSDYYDIQVIPTKEGENSGSLILTFEDSSGKKIEIKKDFSGFAMAEPSYEDDMPMDDSDMPIDQTGEPLTIWHYIGIGFGSFIVSFLITKIITTKIIRKKLEEEI